MHDNEVAKNIVRAALAITVSLVVLANIPKPCLDCCMTVGKGYFSSSFICSSWPKFIAGVSFITICLIVGPKKKWFIAMVAILFFVLLMFEDLRQGGCGWASSLFFSLSFFYYSFLHGVLAGLLAVLSAWYISKLGRVNA